MTVKYEYACNICGHVYQEQRGATEPQFFTDCNKGDGGIYELTNETKIADQVEVISVSEVIVSSVE